MEIQEDYKKKLRINRGNTMLQPEQTIQETNFLMPPPTFTRKFSPIPDNSINYSTGAEFIESSSDLESHLWGSTGERSGCQTPIPMTVNEQSFIMPTPQYIYPHPLADKEHLCVDFETGQYFYGVDMD
ncbi:hypothetical protein RF11_11097 [Thelohanellus kitauei]|uniref:Uncharacterized protein n=1 Tax=Thelohanellus kitauei TaxID=669202 RepID=A0A0C2MQA6_THEKT|nr:hypothetical protein RF11_11097 [Thelohanellus kitauei]